MLAFLSIGVLASYIPRLGLPDALRLLTCRMCELLGNLIMSVCLDAVRLRETKEFLVRTIGLAGVGDLVGVGDLDLESDEVAGLGDVSVAVMGEVVGKVLLIRRPMNSPYGRNRHRFIARVMIRIVMAGTYMTGPPRALTTGIFGRRV